MVEQWLARYKEKQAGEGLSKIGRGGGSTEQKASEGVPKDTCRNCGRAGHWARNCRQPKRKHANLAQQDDDEPAFLMAQACAISIAPNPTPGAVHLDEPLAQAFLSTDDDNDRLDGWYLDTGASNHMTGRSDIYAKLDCAAVGSVRFGDGSVVEIHGCGSIIFAGKKGEHKIITWVYYIPRLKNNIVSLGQLDENGSKVLIEDGVLRIWDQQHCLLAKVQRSRNRLYMLQLDMTRPICLLAHHDEDA